MRATRKSHRAFASRQRCFILMFTGESLDLASYPCLRNEDVCTFQGPIDSELDMFHWLRIGCETNKGSSPHIPCISSQASGLAQCKGHTRASLACMVVWTCHSAP
jgi:hypothetical protein